MSEEETVAELRRQLVQTLRERGSIRSEAVAEAFLRVPREAFVPLAWPSAVYRDIAIPTKFGRHGLPTSSSSQPGIMAPMLEMLRLRPGDHVLEVGAGTGYNAALLRELVGPGGHVVAIDFQPGVAAEAAAHLKHAGYRDVEVIAGDGALGVPARAPFDAIMATAACRDVPVAWWDQLKDGGNLVFPLRRGPMNFAVFALERTEEGFRGIATVGGGFMPLQGPFGITTRLRFHGPRRDFAVLSSGPVTHEDMDLLARLLNSVATAEQPDVLGEVFGAAATPPPGEWLDLQTYLASTEPRLVQLQARTELYGFSMGLALLEPLDESLAVLAPNKLGVGRPRAGDFRPEIMLFGGSAARERVLALLRDFLARGRPRVSRLRLSLKRTRSRRAPWRYEYEYAADG